MDYAALFRRLYDRHPVGVAEDTLMRAEQSLGLALPTPLRQFYLLCGREEGVTAAHNRFISPPALGLSDRRLVFCEENQGVCMWGCLVGEEDPDAEFGNVLRGGALEWHSEEVALSRFLEIMIYLQTAWGGFEHVADLQEPDTAMPTIEAEWAEVVRHNGLTIYERPGLLITALEGEQFLTAAARTPQGLQYLERELGFNPM